MEPIIAAIAEHGPIPFSQFMRIALYDPDHGYYRRKQERFGKAGDYYTAEQLQPVYGRLIAAYLKRLWPTCDLTVLEVGAGRKEMAPYFADFHYLGLDIADSVLLEPFKGFIFTNEFFDALPVDVYVVRDGYLHLMRVDWIRSDFKWVTGESTGEASHLDEGSIVERCPDACLWMARLANRLQSGFIVTVDYGYISSRGLTLMSYKAHQALDEVLNNPGGQDITAHVDFTRLRECGEAAGLRTVRFSTLGQLLMETGEKDGFASALAATSEAEALRLRLQLKTLLVLFGETFRVLVQQK